jgi:hypothetical protein
MRPLNTPPPSSRCTHCNGELRLKVAEHAERTPGFQSQTYVCATCGCELGCLAGHDRYGAHSRVRSHHPRFF